MSASNVQLIGSNSCSIFLDCTYYHYCCFTLGPFTYHGIRQIVGGRRGDDKVHHIDQRVWVLYCEITTKKTGHTKQQDVYLMLSREL